MIFVDSSVWIDYFRDLPTPTAQVLDAKLGVERVLVGDLVLTEVLQGISGDRAFRDARSLMLGLGTIVEVAGHDVAIAAAENYRLLRQRGITVRKTIDTLIATRCIEGGYPLLYSDRDFDPFVTHLGLHSAMPAS